MEDGKPGPLARNELKARWAVLTLLCCALLGSYYCYDNPTAVENQLKQYFGINSNSTSAEASTFNVNYNLLYSVYSFPNTVLPFFGGYLTDKLGVRRMTVVFTLLITLGQLIFAFGCSIADRETSWIVMWIGRTVFGFGGESLSVAQSAMIAQWFAGKELALALGMNLALARVGSVINDVVSVQVATSYPVYYALWVGFGVCILSLAASIACSLIDLRSEKQVVKNIKVYEQVDPIAAAAHMSAILPEKEEVHMNAVFKFSLTFWVLTMSCLTVYCTVLPFNNIASGFIAQKWLAHGDKIDKMSKDRKNALFVKANNIMLITYLTAGVISPFMGWVIDKVGKRAILNMVATSMIVGVHLVLGNTDLYPIGPLLVLGFCYSLYASALWPSVALIVEPEACATAYGVVTAVQNLGLAVSPVVIGLLMPPSHCDDTYRCVEWFFVGLGAVGLLFGIWLNVLDYRSSRHVLNASAKQIAEYERLMLDDDEDDTMKPMFGASPGAMSEGLLDSPGTPSGYHEDWEALQRDSINRANRGRTASASNVGRQEYGSYDDSRLG